MDSHSPLVLTRVAMCQVAQLSSAHHTGVPIIHSRTSNLHIVVWWDTWTLTPARYTAAGMPGTQETFNTAYHSVSARQSCLDVQNFNYFPFTKL